jgi:hypothetical protein
MHVWFGGLVLAYCRRNGNYMDADVEEEVQTNNVERNVAENSSP